VAQAPTLALYGSGVFAIDQLAIFTGFENITLNNFTSGTAEVHLGSSSIAVTGYGAGSDWLWPIAIALIVFVSPLVS
jgi:hypothetical protein